MTRLGQVLRGLLALTLLLAVVLALPWALVRFVGWPLPDHLPSAGEVESALLGALSTQSVLHVLACLCWIVWLYFVIDLILWLAQAARDVVRPAIRSPKPVTGLGAALISTVVMTLLVGRAAASPLSADLGPAVETTPSAATAPLHPSVVRSHGEQVGTASTTTAPPGMVEVTEEVRAPEAGVYDSLWRIADRVLGDGGRWPELYELNRGVQQADGRALEEPGVIRPGWMITAHVPASSVPQQPDEPVSPPTTTTSPAHPTSSEPEPVEADEGAGISLDTGGFVSLALVGVAASAAMSARIWRRRRYRVSSGHRTDLERPMGPVVRSLRFEYRQDIGALRPLKAPEPSSSTSPVIAPQIGVHDGVEVALDLATTRGLGLVGPGANDAARALVLHLLAQRLNGDAVRVILPVDDLQALLPDIATSCLPSAVTIADSLDGALDEVEGELLTRARMAGNAEARPSTGVVLLASPAQHSERRLQAVLDNGSALGLAGVILGPWRAGETVRVRSDGTTIHGTGSKLAGTRLFTLPAAGANELLDLLSQAEGLVHDQKPSDVAPTPPPAVTADGEVRQSVAAPALSQTSCPPLTLRVLGPVELLLLDVEGAPRTLGSVLTPKQREVLAFLAVHPDGARRDALNDAVWPDAKPPRPFNSLHNALSLLRRALLNATMEIGSDLVLNEDGRYRLNNALVSTDYDGLRHALQASQRNDQSALASLREAMDLYRADFAEDVTAAWVEPYRESIRRDVLDAQGILGSTYRDTNPEVALDLLERARNLDRYNEGVYCDIIRLQGRLGRYSAIQRTIRLLAGVLDEIDQRPSDETLSLADALRHQGSASQGDASAT
ncbi:BTAD domain-containing putative transcriptional regulator [Umezawaea sp. NPDC059074]|uniref:BTAD domain-containing putative transcriptional regulator n=1 Tax=Umezawaea sp. NPDC059074 TaxID=3346716 RepID=UPI00368ED9FC